MAQLLTTDERRTNIELTRRLYDRLVAAQVVDPGVIKRFSASPAFGPNSAVGTWAEGRLIEAFSKVGIPAWKYGTGDSGAMTPELRAAMKAEWDRNGKRPDILVGDVARGAPAQAWLALESRSSLTRSNAEHRAKTGRSLSVTVKLEDIVPQTLWVLATGCPLVVVQVLLAPEAYAISWNDVLRACLTTPVTLDRRSQKYTFFLSLDLPAVRKLGQTAVLEQWGAKVVESEASGLASWLDPVGVGQIAISPTDLTMLRTILTR